MLLIINIPIFAQTHIEYISEKTDTMALISKQDIDVINRIFVEKALLDSLNVINEQIILRLEEENVIKSSVIEKQKLIIENDKVVIDKLNHQNEQLADIYSKELRRERNKKISFQATTGVGIIAIILILLL